MSAPTLPGLDTPAPTSEPTPAEPEHLTVADLLRRGWTEAGVRRFLGEPDATRPNPWYRSAAPLRLYALSRVLEAEGSVEYRAWLNASEKRREAARRAASKREQDTLAGVDAVRIELPSFDREELERQAVDNRNYRAAERALRRMERGEWDEETGWDQATAEDADPAALARWCVNYLRHQGTSYDADLRGLWGRTGRDEASRRLRGRIFEEITRAYPWLADEARRQRQEREGGW